MQEAIFNLRLKKWSEAVRVLEANADSLASAELDAFSTLKNLWRSVQFSPATTRRVERMVKLLSDSDKLHGNNRDIVQASKDFRGVAREMYTTDEETLRQFADAMQKAVGGPRMSAQQQARRNVAATTPSTERPVSAYRPAPTHRTTTSSRPVPPGRPNVNNRSTASRSSTAGTSSARQPRQPQRPKRPSALQHAVRRMAATWPTLAAVVVLLSLIGFGVYTAWTKATAIAPYNYTTLLEGTWNGEVAGLPATLIFYSTSPNKGKERDMSLQAALYVKKRSGLVKDTLTVKYNIQREGCYMTLSKAVDSDSLSEAYRLFIAPGSCSLCGNLIDANGEKAQTVNLNNGGKGTMSQLATAGAPQYVLYPLFADSVKCYRAVLKDTAWVVNDYSKWKVFPRGTIIDSCGLPRSAEGRIIFMNGGKHYQVSLSSLKWSKTNPDSLRHSLTADAERRHSDVGIFFTTLWPCWLVVGLIGLPFLLTIILPLLLSRFKSMHKLLSAVLNAMVVVMPLCLTAVAIIEIADYQLLGGQAFWWCDKDRYGFVGSALRIVPFLLVVVAQVMSIWWYEGVLFAGRENKKIHMKTAAICFLVSIPTVIIFLLVTQLGFGWKGKSAEWTAAGLFLAIVLTGIIVTFVRNIKETGAWRGTLITLFVLVYIVGCMVAVGGLVIAILQVLIPLLCGLIGIIVIGALLLGGGRGETLYRDRYGNLYRRV